MSHSTSSVTLGDSNAYWNEPEKSLKLSDSLKEASMEVTVFIEACVRQGCSIYYGPSLFIEHGGKNYLLEACGSTDFAKKC